LARAILRRAEEEGITVPVADEYRLLPGKGAEGVFAGKAFWIGSHRFLHEKLGEPPDVHRQAVALEDAGHTVVAVGTDEHVCGLISIADRVREAALQTVERLRNLGVRRIVLLTGDNEQTAREVARVTGVDDYHAELLPEDKVQEVELLRRDYRSAAMIGDGVNDAPAMAASTLGIAMGAMGTDAAIETADVALMSDDLSRLPWLIGHSRRTLSVIRQNVSFALGLKALFVVLTLAGAASLWMAIAADMGASLLVIFNGLRLLRIAGPG
jgi:Cd2+/Zn2+-exporting ATPase